MDIKKIIQYSLSMYVITTTFMSVDVVCSSESASDLKENGGRLTLMNLTGKQLYAGVYQYNYERAFNTKAGEIISIEADSTVTLAVPPLICIATTTIAGITSCSSHSRIRLFVSTQHENNVLQNQKGFLNSAILDLDPSLWYMQVRPQKTYLVFYNGFFFDPWYATEGVIAPKSKVDSLNRDDGAYLYPMRLNIIEKVNKRFDITKRYTEFQRWMTEV